MFQSRSLTASVACWTHRAVGGMIYCTIGTFMPTYACADMRMMVASAPCIYHQGRQHCRCLPDCGTIGGHVGLLSSFLLHLLLHLLPQSLCQVTPAVIEVFSQTLAALILVTAQVKSYGHGDIRLQRIVCA